MYRYLTLQGITVAKVGSKFIEIQYPTTEELESFDKVYMGGYIHIVSEEEAEELINAGYEVSSV